MSQRALEIDGIRCDPEEVRLWIAAYAIPLPRPAERADDAVRAYRKRCVLADEAP